MLVSDGCGSGRVGAGAALCTGAEADAVAALKILESGPVAEDEVEVEGHEGRDGAAKDKSEEEKHKKRESRAVEGVVKGGPESVGGVCAGPGTERGGIYEEKEEGLVRAPANACRG